MKSAVIRVSRFGPAPHAIVLDFDGTVVDSASLKTEAFFQVVSCFGEEVAEAARQYHLLNQGMNRAAKFKWLSNKFQLNLTDRELRDLSESFSRIVVDSVISSDLLPGAEIFLNRDSETPMFLISATPSDELRMILESRHITECFTAFFGYPPEKSESLRFILNRWNLTANETLMIGDSRSDLDAANSCGVNFIGLRTTKEMWPEGTAVVDTLADLVSVLN
jgi:phosphoglycolate phosphatase